MRTLEKVALAAVFLSALAFAGVGAVQAHGETPPPPSQPGPMGPGHGPGSKEGRGMLGEYADIMHEAIAEVLGISEAAFEQARVEGETLLELAREHEVEFEELRAAIQTARGEMIEAALEDGAISAEQAEWFSSRPAGAGPRGGRQIGPCHRSGPWGHGPGTWDGSR